VHSFSVNSNVLVRPEILTAMAVKIIVIWDLQLCSLVHRHSSYSSTLKMEIVCSSETLQYLYIVTWCHILIVPLLHIFMWLYIFFYRCLTEFGSRQAFVTGSSVND